MPECPAASYVWSTVFDIWEKILRTELPDKQDCINSVIGMKLMTIGPELCDAARTNNVSQGATDVIHGRRRVEATGIAGACPVNELEEGFAR